MSNGRKVEPPEMYRPFVEPWIELPRIYYRRVKSMEPTEEDFRPHYWAKLEKGSSKKDTLAKNFGVSVFCRPQEVVELIEALLAKDPTDAGFVARLDVSRADWGVVPVWRYGRDYHFELLAHPSVLHACVEEVQEPDDV